jgi:hypothetical protein
VVQPAYGEIKQLNEEHQVMQGALDEAEKALGEVATELRAETDAAADPFKPAGIIPGPVTPGPTQPAPVEPTAVRTRNSRQLADRLDKLAGRLKQARAQRPGAPTQ